MIRSGIRWRSPFRWACPRPGRMFPRGKDKSMADPTLFSLVVPTYNEAANIVDFLESAHAALNGQPHEIIVVDDNSPDGTADRVRRLGEANPWVRVIVRRAERGLGSAVLRGFQEARGGWLGVMDADRQHDERILPFMVEAL